MNISCPNCGVTGGIQNRHVYECLDCGLSIPRRLYDKWTERDREWKRMERRVCTLETALEECADRRCTETRARKALEDTH